MPPDTENREIRHEEIRSLLQAYKVQSQGELVELLRERGITATQSSVSRDLRDLGVAWMGGRYTMPSDHDVRDPGVSEVAHFLRGVRPAGTNLTVIFTFSGMAQAVGIALDNAGWPELVGTISGDDTVFVATASARDQKRLIRRLDAFLRER
ncbi:MAG TPA: ArgR family transcriptional regulator [Thermoanaerobaculia bacterium]|jgi:transcriptional regulator of arginine metabolism|nr:ArgR family transcriptional regulator [Thermoanaerobaculia bacterium]